MTINKVLKKKKRGGGGGSGKSESEETSETKAPEIEESLSQLTQAVERAGDMVESLTPRRSPGGGCGCGG
jgi:hypothetical protein